MSLSVLSSTPFQIQILLAQVWRQNQWITLPIQNAAGTIQKGSSGTIVLTMSLDDTNALCRLYEGERIRVYSGIYGASLERRFTGFVDAPQVVNTVQGSLRTVTCSDNIKELKDAIILQPRIYDGIEPNAAVADALNQALTTGQLKLYNDAGQLLSQVNNYDQAGGNGILDAPRIFNDDGSTYYLPQGILASTMTLQGASQSITIPPASGTNNFIEVQLPWGYIIASTMSSNLGTPLTAGNTLPPASGTYFLDSYNGICYFNNAQAQSIFKFATYRYDTPLFGYQLGTSVGDVVAALMDKTGQHFNVDEVGKFHIVSATLPRVPARFLGRDQYIQNGIQSNRDRKNVIVCEGWDGNCNNVIAAKAILYEDTILQPPQGLGKRAYTIVQDPAWKTQYAVNKAAYYAAMEIGRRGKIMSLTMIDDPTIQLDDTLAFLGAVQEISDGDFFVVESINWQVGMFSGKHTSQATITGTLLPGRSTIYIGPSPATTGAGNLDYTVDTQPIFNCYLNPGGGTTASVFSISNGGVSLNYTVGQYPIYENIDIYGSDGSHTVVESNILRPGGTFYSLTMPSTAFTPGCLYVMYLWALEIRPNMSLIDVNNASTTSGTNQVSGNVGAYRDCITALL